MYMTLLFYVDTITYACLNPEAGPANHYLLVSEAPLAHSKLTGEIRRVEAETKWPTFSRRHFDMHFLE